MLSRTGPRAALAIALALGTAAAAPAQFNFDFSSSDQGFTNSLISGSSAANWTYSATGGVGGVGAWSTPGADSATEAALTSPTLIVGANGTISGSFNHRFNFDASITPTYFDGGTLQFQVNGGGFQQVNSALVTGVGYTGTISGAGNPLVGFDAFSATSAGNSTPVYVTTSFALGTTGTAQSFTAGDQVQLRFTGGWDSNTLLTSPNWQIGGGSISNLAPVPEPASVLAVGALATGGLTWLRRRRQVRA
jgi:hypothetical protein